MPDFRALGGGSDNPASPARMENTVIKPDQLIPPDSELGQLLAHLSDSTDDTTWKIARITNDLVEELDGGSVTKTEIYRAVAARCKGKSPRTIRSWAEVAMDVSPKVEKKYKNLLSFDHFKVARRLFQHGYTPDIEYALDWAVNGNDNKLTAGTFHSVNAMLFHFLPKEEGGMEHLFWSKIKDKLYDNSLMHDNDTERKELFEAWGVFERIWGLDKNKNV